MSNLKLRLKTDIQGNSESDLVDALRELIRLIDNGFTSGFNSNDDGKFSFDISGEH